MKEKMIGGGRMSATVIRERKSRFVRLFDKTPPGIVCPHFYELILSNGCPFDCSYCYLNLTFRGRKSPVLFCNAWEQVLTELESVDSGVFSTGELADSLAVVPPLLERAMDYFSNQHSRYLLLVTKSTNIEPLLKRDPNHQIIISFSVNSEPAAVGYELGCPPPALRLEAARRLIDAGWRVRIRLDPVIIQSGLEHYESTCNLIADLRAERVTLGSLRQYSGVHNFAKAAPREGLLRAADGRLRYPTEVRIQVYEQLANWLGFQPALCKESLAVWKSLGWRFYGCNCTD